MELFLKFVPFVVALIAVVTFIVLTIKVLGLRRVVTANEVHIVQTSRKRVSYGGGRVEPGTLQTAIEAKASSEHSNTYYEWPSWVPVYGVTKTVLPLAVFTLDLNNYQAYDRDRLPFMIHLMGFFRISDSNKAAERVSSIGELHAQLIGVTQGAVRAVLAQHTVQEIMQQREVFAEQFTNAIKENVKNWGVETVKSLELMDIKDADKSQVIHNIMEKKKSHIEMESRTEVAKNTQAWKTAEIEANREVEIRTQEAAQVTGLRKIETDRQVSLQEEAKVQAIVDQKKLTKTKEMEVRQVELTRTAEIERQVQVVFAEQNKQTSVLNAEAQKTTQVLIADGKLESLRREAEGKFEVQRRDADGTKLLGEAKASAEAAMLMAPVTAQIALAEKISTSDGYQSYLVNVRKLEADQAIGVAQAEALANADIKVFANTGSVTQGINGLGELLSTKGGLALGGAIEAIAATPTGQEVLGQLGVVKKKTNTNANANAAPKQ